MPETTGLVQMSGLRIAVQQLPEQAGFALRVGETTELKLPDHLDARIEGFWSVGAHRLVLIDGPMKPDATGKPCPSRPHLVLVRAAQASIRPLGKCEDRFAYSATVEQWGARQSNARDPFLWNFRDGNLAGPVAQSALNRRARLPVAPERPAEPGAGESLPNDLRPEPPHIEPPRPPAPASVAPGLDPRAPPAISRPVGEDVIPPPVGAAPLPGPAPAPPRLF